MSYQVHRTLIVLLTALFMVSTLALAAVTKMAGTIQDVDMQKGCLTLRSADGGIVALRVPTELLAGLQPGEVMAVKTSGGTVTGISQKESAQRSRSGQPSNMQQSR